MYSLYDLQFTTENKGQLCYLLFCINEAVCDETTDFAKYRFQEGTCTCRKTEERKVYNNCQKLKERETRRVATYITKHFSTVDLIT